MARPGERGYDQKPMTTEMAGDRKHWHDMNQAGTIPSIEAGICEKVRTILNNYCSGLFFNVKCQQLMFHLTHNYSKDNTNQHLGCIKLMREILLTKNMLDNVKE